jgi:hypothetical protein
VGTRGEHGDPDIGAIVLAGAAFACDKNDELLFHRRGGLRLEVFEMMTLAGVRLRPRTEQFGSLACNVSHSLE